MLPRGYVYLDIEENDEAAADLAKKYISVLSDKNLEAAIGTDEESPEVVAVLYVGYNYDSFSFDVVVHENHRRKGLARKLVQIAVKQFEQMKNAFGEDFHMKVYVVNPDMERLLKSMGFNVEKRMERNNTLMTMESSIMQALREMTVSGCKKKKMIFRDN